MHEVEQQDWRRLALGAVVIALMAVSVGGQIQAIEPVLKQPFAAIFAIAHDAGAILALEAGLKAERGSSVRKWAWIAILMAAGTGGFLNVWHVVVQPMQEAGTVIPPELLGAFGLLLGVEPIALILVLSHLVGLVLTEGKADRQPGTASKAASAASSGRQQHRQGDRQPDRRETHVVIASTASTDRQQTASGTARTATQTARTATASVATPPALTTASSASRHRHPDRQQARQVSAAALPSTSQASARVGFPGPRPDWMTDALLAAVVASMRRARQERKPYGRPRLMDEHGLNTHKAKTVLGYVEKHDLLRASA